MVTHSTGSILEYADRCLVMSDGMLVGNTTDVLAAVLAYEKGMLMTERTDTAEKKAVSQTGKMHLLMNYPQYKIRKPMPKLMKNGLVVVEL